MKEYQLGSSDRGTTRSGRNNSRGSDLPWSSPPLLSMPSVTSSSVSTGNNSVVSNDDYDQTRGRMSSPRQQQMANRIVNDTATVPTIGQSDSERRKETERESAPVEQLANFGVSLTPILQRPPLYSGTNPVSGPVSPFVSAMDSNLFHDKVKGHYPNSDLEIGHLVKIQIEGQMHSGVVRWLGTQSEETGDKLIAGLEMDVSNEYFSDGTFSNKRYFTCPPLRGLFVYADQCKKDPLFLDSSSALTFGDIECPLIPGSKPPMEITNSNMVSICGRNKGIQGHHNSCYLDATLFSMFAFSEVFDCLIQRPKRPHDVSEYEEVQKVLKEAIVNPLRTSLYVRADNVLHLRHLLDKLGSVTGLTCEEKDPEEFLNSLLQQILKVEPFLKLNSGQESFYYQLFVEKKERITFPTIQYLLQQSFYSSNIKLGEEPSCLIVLMPRFGKQYKMYSKIFPNLDLEVSEIIENVPRLCSICGQAQATYECIECLNESDPHDLRCAFCEACKTTFHQHPNRMKHKSAKLNVINRPVKSIEMKLFAVVCIETSHYVAFVKCGKQPDSPWCFFDSMADRIGGQNGFNVPEVVACEDLNYWLSNDGYEQLLSQNGDSQQPVPPNYVNRLLSDAYLCMYYSRNVSMYK